MLILVHKLQTVVLPIPTSNVLNLRVKNIKSNLTWAHTFMYGATFVLFFQDKNFIKNHKEEEKQAT